MPRPIRKFLQDFERDSNPSKFIQKNAPRFTY